MNRHDSILAAINTRFTGISTAGGYHTDFLTVDIWRTKQLLDANLPACIIRDKSVVYLEPRKIGRAHV